MAPVGLIVTIVLKVFQLRQEYDTTLIVRNATGEYGFTAVQCTSSLVGLEGETNVLNLNNTHAQLAPSSRIGSSAEDLCIYLSARLISTACTCMYIYIFVNTCVSFLYRTPHQNGSNRTYTKFNVDVGVQRSSQVQIRNR